MATLCACGCGLQVKPGRKYRHGHWAKTPEGRQLRRECRIGQRLSPETRAKMSAAHVGHSVSDRMMAALTARNKSGWQKTVADKISKTLTGRTLPPEHVSKLKAKEKHGAAHKWWRGGTSVYPPEWQSARRMARKRDGGMCLGCGGGVLAGSHRAHDVHHVDGNKQDCRQSNLITLCRSCHATAENHLAISISKFRAILSARYGYVYD